MFVFVKLSYHRAISDYYMIGPENRYKKHLGREKERRERERAVIFKQLISLSSFGIALHVVVREPPVP